MYDYFYSSEIIPDDIYLDDYYMDEILAWIPDAYGKYLISNKGRVYSCATQSFLKGKPMDNHGHLGVCLYIDGIRIYKYIHRLMAEVFIPNPHGFPIVRHLDDDPENNELENLAWGTMKDNHDDCVRNGHARYPTPEMREIGLVKLRKPIVAVDLETGKRLRFRGQTEASRILGVEQSNIWKVLNGERHSAGGYSFRYIKKRGRRRNERDN